MVAEKQNVDCVNVINAPIKAKVNSERISKHLFKND
jgi:hypothetical protein